MALASQPFATCVLDTGPLLSAIALEFAFERPLSQQQVILPKIPLEPYLKRTANRESFVLLFRSIKTVLTTPHVVAEIQGNRFLHGDLQGEFWLHAIGLFRARGIEERTLRLLDLDSKGLGNGRRKNRSNQC